MRYRTGPPSGSEGPSRCESLPKHRWTEIAAKGPSQLFLHLVQPLAVGVDDPLGKPRVEPKRGRPVRERGGALLGVDAFALEHVEVFTQRVKALEQFPPIGVLRAQ